MPEPIAIHLRGDAATRRVWLNHRILTPERSQAIYNHSPDGFAWGYGGSGPAQLALAILLELFTEEQAFANYQAFKCDTIARLPKSDFDATIKFTIQ